jgi:hypothetical protein
MRQSANSTRAPLIMKTGNCDAVLPQRGSRRGDQTGNPERTRATHPISSAVTVQPADSSAQALSDAQLEGLRPCR